MASGSFFADLFGNSSFGIMAIIGIMVLVLFILAALWILFSRR